MFWFLVWNQFLNFFSDKCFKYFKFFKLFKFLFSGYVFECKGLMCFVYNSDEFMVLMMEAFYLKIMMLSMIVKFLFLFSKNFIYMMNLFFINLLINVVVKLCCFFWNLILQLLNSFFLNFILLLFIWFFFICVYNFFELSLF